MERFEGFPIRRREGGLWITSIWTARGDAPGRNHFVLTPRSARIFEGVRLDGLPVSCVFDAGAPVDAVSRLWIRGWATPTGEASNGGGRWARLDEVSGVDLLTDDWLGSWIRLKPEIEDLYTILDEVPGDSKRARLLLQRDAATRTLREMGKLRSSGPLPPSLAGVERDFSFRREQEGFAGDAILRATAPIGLAPEGLEWFEPSMAGPEPGSLAEASMEEAKADSRHRFVPFGLQVEELDASTRSELLLHDATLVRGVVPRGPADDAGVRPGDILWILYSGPGDVQGKRIHGLGDLPVLAGPFREATGTWIGLGVLRSGRVVRVRLLNPDDSRPSAFERR